MTTTKSIPLFVLFLLIFIAGCTESSVSNSESNSDAANATLASINTHCPITGEEVDSEESVEWEGKSVAFCCAACIPKWNELSDEEKKLKLDVAGQDGHSEHHGHGN